VVLKQGEGDGFSFGDGAAQSGSESPLAAVASGTMIEVLDGTITLALRRSPAALQVVDIQASVTEVDGQVVFDGTGLAALPAHPAVRWGWPRSSRPTKEKSRPNSPSAGSNRWPSWNWLASVRRRQCCRYP